MIERYCREEMAEIWSDEAQFRSWLRVERAIVGAWAELGEVPRAVADEIDRAELEINVPRIAEIEAVVDHDMIAFVKMITEQLSESAAACFHFGVTSYDVEDTALGLRLTEALGLIREGAIELRRVIWEKARDNKGTVMMGRTHGVHAEPITLAFKLCVWLDDLDRSLERLEQAIERVKVGKISGAVGTYANVDPRVERLVCMRLGLKPAPVSTQIISRDVHAEALCALALLAGQLERMATEIRNLQRTELLEVSEPFKKGQRGSSAMPHKRNPWRCETVSGLARVVRGNLIPALENLVTWHERDLANSSVERIIIPDTCCLVDWMLHRFANIMRGLQVHPQNMKRSLELTRGVIFSQQVRLALSESGLSYDDAYDIAQKYALQAWEEQRSYRELLEQDRRVTDRLTPAQLDACFDPSHHLRHLSAVYERFEL